MAVLVVLAVVVLACALGGLTGYLSTQPRTNPVNFDDLTREEAIRWAQSFQAEARMHLRARLKAEADVRRLRAALLVRGER